MRSLDREIKKHKKLLIIDGYNLINAWDNLKPIGSISLEESRKKLIDILLEFNKYTDEGIILVFDSYNVKSDADIKLSEGVIIVYTRENELADHFIEWVVYKYSKRKEIRVVTSDFAEQNFILGSGANRVSAREFRYEIESFYRDIEKLSNKNKAKNLARFSGLDENTKETLENFKKLL